jgi:hypothetical protein
MCLQIGAQTVAAASTGANQTGWSNGGEPEAPTVPLTVCPQGRIIESWIVGEGDVASNVGPLLSIVFVQARCSDGSLLPPIQAYTKVATKHDQESNSDLSSASGYTCSKLLGYNNGGNWMMNFMGVGQPLAKDAAGTPLKLNCAAVPPSYVAIGYGGVTGGAVNAINFVMGPAATNSSTTAPPLGAAAASPAPTQPPAPPAAVSLGPGAIAGIVVSGLVAVSTVITIAYKVWRWMHEHKNVAAAGKQLPQWG